MPAQNNVMIVKTLDVPLQVDFADLADIEKGRLLSESETTLLENVMAALPFEEGAKRYSKKELGAKMAEYALTHPELGIEWPEDKVATRGVLKEPNGVVYAIYKGVKHSKELGAGSFGKVKLVQNITTGEWDVIKVQRYQALFPKIITDEHQALTNTGLSSGQVAKRNSQANESEIEKHHFIMKYAKGGSLENFLNAQTQLPVIQGLDIALQMAEEVYSLHQKGYLHCDIKPSNILYDPVTGKVSIIDLGLAIKMQNGEARPSVFGDSFYRAPEVGYLPKNHVTLTVPKAGNDQVFSVTHSPNTKVNDAIAAAVINPYNFDSDLDLPNDNMHDAGSQANSDAYNSDTVMDLSNANGRDSKPATSSDAYHSDTVIDIPNANVRDAKHVTITDAYNSDTVIDLPNANARDSKPATSSDAYHSDTVIDLPNANMSDSTSVAGSNPYNSDTVIDLPSANMRDATPVTSSDPYNSYTVRDLPTANVLASQGVYTPVADIYSLGISLARLYGYFDLHGQPEHIDMRSSADENRALHDLVGSMINPDPALRPSLLEVMDQLKSIREKILPIYPKTIGIVQIQDYIDAPDKKAFCAALKSIDSIILADKKNTEKDIIDYSEIRQLLEKEGVAVSTEILISNDLVKLVSKVRELDQVRVSKANEENKNSAISSQICYIHSPFTAVPKVDGVRDITIDLTIDDKDDIKVIAEADEQADQPQVKNVILKLSEEANHLSSKKNYRDLKKVNDTIQRIAILSNTEQVSLEKLITELSLLHSQFRKQSNTFFQSKTVSNIGKLIHRLQKDMTQSANSKEFKLKRMK